MGKSWPSPGRVAQSADQGRGLPDYLVAAGDFVPSAQFRYGIRCDGELPLLVRFLPAEAESPVGLSTIVACALEADAGAARGNGDPGRLCGACGSPVASIAGESSPR